MRDLWKTATASRAVNHAGLVTISFALSQVVRLGTNIILAWLLAPAIFGVMTLINTLRTGVELLTDIGIRQNIVVSDHGGEPAFFNTAWTLQVIRGGGLMLIGLITAWPLSRLYGKPELFPILSLCSTIFLLVSLHSPGRVLMQRRREVGKVAAVDLAYQTISGLVSILFAMMMPTVWGMVWAMVVYTLISLAISFGLMDMRLLKPMIDQRHAKAILAFGKWIFVSSLIFFFGTNFDRLYLPTAIPIALFGVYGIARVVGDAATILMQKIGEIIIVPAAARLGDGMAEQLPRIRRIRRWGLLAIGAGIGFGIAIGDLFVSLVYDSRYAAAMVLLPVLLMGTWFSVQSALAEATLLGLARPQFAAAGNAARLGWNVILLPIMLAKFGLLAGIMVIAASDVPRYLVLLFSQLRAGLNFVADDLGSAAMVLLTAWLTRLAMIGLGLADGLITTAQWHELALLH